MQKIFTRLQCTPVWGAVVRVETAGRCGTFEEKRITDQIGEEAVDRVYLQKIMNRLIAEKAFLRCPLTLMASVSSYVPLVNKESPF